MASSRHRVPVNQEIYCNDTSISKIHTNTLACTQRNNEVYYTGQVAGLLFNSRCIKYM